ncbi:serine/threonine-protein phosphatase with EF-hands 1 [Ctenodactylus gundi]
MAAVKHQFKKKNKTMMPVDPGTVQLRNSSVICKWYEAYRNRLKIREKYALGTLQSAEYMDEDNQIQLHSFFSYMLEKYADVHKENPELAREMFQTTFQNIEKREDFVGLSHVSLSFEGPRLQFPLTFVDLDLLIEAFKKQQILHVYYVLEVIYEATKILKQLPNFNRTKTSPFKDIVICGDLHGQLDDLLLIFYKNGLPSENKSYVFNGDFVDRGQNSVEILMILLVGLIVYPDGVFLNRGNHEDVVMNIRYGFIQELSCKYKPYGTKIAEALEELFAWLPLGTIIDEEILVVHGGISESTDLDLLHCIERQKMISVIPSVAPRSPAPSRSQSTARDFHSKQLRNHECQQIVDIIWSDPQFSRGCCHNTNRGLGCCFGPDVTTRILDKYHLKMLIRSHECKIQGYDIEHDGKVVTVFSASNYYGTGSNQGAYIKLSYGMSPQVFKFLSCHSVCQNLLHQRVNVMESIAFRILKEKIMSRKIDLFHAFKRRDHAKSGKISVMEWALTMDSVLELNLPWKSLSTCFVEVDKTGHVQYMSTFENNDFVKPEKQAETTLTEILCKYRLDLQAVFDIINSGHSGKISMEEFRASWKLFCSHYNVRVNDSQIEKFVKAIDLNRDGSIDFNDFFKAFCAVYKYELKESDRQRHTDVNTLAQDRAVCQCQDAELLLGESQGQQLVGRWIAFQLKMLRGSGEHEGLLLEPREGGPV